MMTVQILLAVSILIMITAHTSAEIMYRKTENTELLKTLDSICTYSLGMIIVLILIMVIIN